jgi:hypothetical protein
MFGKAEIDRRVEAAMIEPETKWTKKNRVGLRAKIAKEVWMKADEVSKDAVNAKIAEITEKRKETGARGAEQYLELVLKSHSHTFHLPASPVRSRPVRNTYVHSSPSCQQKQAGRLRY